MTGLVDSLMGTLDPRSCASHVELTHPENFYIPPIILNKKPRSSRDGASSRHTFVCVDGKQRLSSVRAFIKGMIPCTDHRGEKWWYCIALDTAGGRKRKVLPEKDRQTFINKELISFEYAGLTQEQEEDLFARVQMGVQLTLAEKMRASTGPWQELARCYVEDYPAIYSLLKDRTRAKDFQITLSCFSQILEVQHPSAANGIPMLRTNHTHLPKLLGNSNAVDDGVKSHLARVWNTFQHLLDLDPNTFTNADRRLRGVQTFAPIEMVAVTVLISMYSDSRNNRLLIGDIQALRDALREYFSDLRLNTATWRFIWDFIDWLEPIRGAVNGKTAVGGANAKAASTHGASIASALPLENKRTTKPTIASNPSAVKAKSENITAASPLVGPRPRKRLRVDDTELMTQFSLRPLEKVVGSSRATSPPTNPQRSNTQPFDTASPFPSAVARNYRVSSSMPARTQPTHTPAAALAPPSRTSHSPHHALRLTGPSEAPQNHILGLNGCRDHAALEEQGPALAATTPCTASVPTFSSGPQALPSRSMPPPRIGKAASSKPVPAPIRTELSSAHDWSSSSAAFFTSGPMNPLPSPSKEVLHNTSPTVAPAQSLSTLKTEPEPDIRPRVPPRPLPQYDGAIDLTSDDEDGGTRLLALFGATVSAGKLKSTSTSREASEQSARAGSCARQHCSP